MTKISFVICTYNPPRARLKQVLSCIFGMQAYETGLFEVLVVDNNSKPQLGLDDISVDGRSATLIREEIPGLTAARVRGFRESRGEALVYVDDDNLLAYDYGIKALELLQRHPDIGVFSANISGVFEESPEAWMKPYLPYLALTDVTEDKWSFSTVGGCLPVGAGMVVRRSVMDHYAKQVDNNVGRASLDRNGKSLLAGGDTDIGYCAIKIHQGCGIFKDLKLKHLIPRERLDKKYLWKLVAGVTASHYFLEITHNSDLPKLFQRMKWYFICGVCLLFPRKSYLRFRSARTCGKLQGLRLYHRYR